MRGAAHGVLFRLAAAATPRGLRAQDRKRWPAAGWAGMSVTASMGPPPAPVQRASVGGGKGAGVGGCTGAAASWGGRRGLREALWLARQAPTRRPTPQTHATQLQAVVRAQPGAPTLTISLSLAGRMRCMERRAVGAGWWGGGARDGVAGRAAPSTLQPSSHPHSFPPSRRPGPRTNPWSAVCCAWPSARCPSRVSSGRVVEGRGALGPGRGRLRHPPISHPSALPPPIARQTSARRRRPTQTPTRPPPSPPC